MKKLCVALLLGSSLIFTGCGNSAGQEAPAAQTEEKTEAETTEAVEPTAEAADASKDTAEEEKTETEESASAEADKITELPAYADVEEDPFISTVYESLLADTKDMFDGSGVSIPSYIPIDQNFDNPEDITLWGYFMVNNYDLEGSTLVNNSGGSLYGLMHLKENGDGYELISFDKAQDDNELKELCKANNFDDSKFAINDEERVASNESSLCSYVDKFDLPVDSYQDPGSDKVMLHSYRTALSNMTDYIWSAIYASQFDYSKLEKITGKDLSANVLDVATAVCAQSDPFYLVMKADEASGSYILTPDAVLSFQSGTLNGDEKTVEEAMALREADADGCYNYVGGDWGATIPFTKLENVEIDQDGNATLTGKLGTEGEDKTSHDFTIKFSKSFDAPGGCSFEELTIK
ncbi:MAG: hypothetical protein K5931_04990 [Lachnospiraceae bacterium]|nr:hypothetical protein [Lachnospiraceae bacterium]